MRFITWHWADWVSNDRHYGTVEDCTICNQGGTDGQAATVQDVQAGGGGEPVPPQEGDDQAQGRQVLPVSPLGTPEA